MKKALLLLTLTALIVSFSYSQLKTEYHILGGSMGFSSYNSNVIIGANYEYQLPQSGVGLFGIGAMTRFWSFSEKILENTGQLDYNNIAIGGQLNYNFNRIGTGKFIPFVGVVLGYNNVSTKYTSYNGKDLIGYVVQVFVINNVGDDIEKIIMVDFEFQSME